LCDSAERKRFGRSQKGTRRISKDKSATPPRAGGVPFFLSNVKKNYFYDFKLLRAPPERTIALRFPSARLLFPFQNQN